jgi:hypothetical protein
MNQIDETLKDRLLKLAKQKTISLNDDFCAVDYAGSNVDDAFEMGVEEGETFLAREILHALNIEF